MNKVYVIWNPLHERVVCAHSSEDKTCKKCEAEREAVSNTAYSLAGKWIEVDSDEELCYCGSRIDETNPDCIEYKLCKEHAEDV